MLWNSGAGADGAGFFVYYAKAPLLFISRGAIPCTVLFLMDVEMVAPQ
jgi:hypothetical protein